MSIQIWKILQIQIKSMQKDFLRTLKLKELGKCYDFYLKSDTLLWINVFENFRKIYIIYIL